MFRICQFHRKDRLLIGIDGELVCRQAQVRFLGNVCPGFDDRAENTFRRPGSPSHLHPILIFGIRGQPVLNKGVFTDGLSVAVQNGVAAGILADAIIASANGSDQFVSSALGEVQIAIEIKGGRRVLGIGPGQTDLGVRRIVKVLTDGARKPRRRLDVIDHISNDREDAFLGIVHQILQQAPGKIISVSSGRAGHIRDRSGEGRSPGR